MLNFIRECSLLRNARGVIASIVLAAASGQSFAGETVFSSFASCGGVSTAGAYDSAIDVALSGWGTITRDRLPIDAFYALSPADPSVSLGPHDGLFRFSRADQGGCTCAAQCADQGLSGAVVGPIPFFNPSHEYSVQLNLGVGEPERVTFGAEGCECADNSGGIAVAIRSCTDVAECDDGNACTFDSCDAGTCTHGFFGGDCDDGNRCSGNDGCLFGVCVGEPLCFSTGMRLRPERPVLVGGFFGGAVAAGGGTVVVGAGFDDIAGVFRVVGAAYVFDAASGEFLFKLRNPEPLDGPSTGSPNFGASVALGEDRIVVGAPGQRDDEGTAYLFELTSGALVRVLRNPDPAPNPGEPVPFGDRFGTAVAIAGGKVFVSAPDDENKGVVYVFAADSGVLLGRLDRADADPPFRFAGGFGKSLAVLDGRLLVGDPVARTASGLGAVYVFDVASGTLRDTFPNPQGFAAGFGESVAVLGSNILVGGNNVVFLIDGATGEALQTFPNPDTQVFGFGYFLGGGHDRVLVGVGSDGNGGRVYVFDAATGTLLRTLTDPAPNAPAIRGFGNFGVAIVASGDTFLVGAPEDADFRGTVYVLDADARTIVGGFQQPMGRSFFGESVTATDSEILVGAPGDFAVHPTEGGRASGRVYRYVDGVPAGTIDEPLPETGDRFGAALAARSGRVLIGAPGRAAGPASRVGAVFLVDDRPGGAPEIQPVEAPAGQAGDAFGSAVALTDDGTLIVGASYADAGAPDAGAVYVFDRSTGDLLRTLTAPVPRRSAQFGATIAVAAGEVLIGAPLEETDTRSIDTGAVYRFDVVTGNLVERLESPAPTSREQFGFSLASAGSRLLAGAPGSRSAYLLETSSGISRATSRRRMSLDVEVDAAAPACVGGYCFDGNPCTRDLCDLTRGGCVFEPRADCSGCANDLQCRDPDICNGLEHCFTCDGCFLHEWSCCDQASRCVRGRPAKDGTTCDDGANCSDGGMCEAGVCQCLPINPRTPDCPGCDDEDPCTRDTCAPDGECSHPPRVGYEAVTCVFERPFPALSCAGQRVPGGVVRSFDAAHRKVLDGASATTRRRRRLLSRAARLLTRARKSVTKARSRGRTPLTSTCAADLTNDLQAIKGRVRDVRRDLHS